MLGHDSFLALPYRLLEESAARTNNPLGEKEPGLLQTQEQLLQKCPPHVQWLSAEQPISQPEQIKEYVRHGPGAPDMPDLERVGELMSGQHGA
jgi:hypothetical protein